MPEEKKEEKKENLEKKVEEPELERISYKEWAKQLFFIITKGEQHIASFERKIADVKSALANNKFILEKGKLFKDDVYFYKKGNEYSFEFKNVKRKSKKQTEENHTNRGMYV